MDGPVFYQISPGVVQSRRTVRMDEKLTVVCYGAKVVAFHICIQLPFLNFASHLHLLPSQAVAQYAPVSDNTE